jgi:hypothetical protein
MICLLEVVQSRSLHVRERSEFLDQRSGSRSTFEGIIFRLVVYGLKLHIGIYEILEERLWLQALELFSLVTQAD